VNHKGNIKFPNPLLPREVYQIRKGEKNNLMSSKCHLTMEIKDSMEYLVEDLSKQ
jgi:hypothetical protein